MPLVLDQGSDLKMWKPENYGKNFMDLQPEVGLENQEIL